MHTDRALRLHGYGGVDSVRVDQAPPPRPGAGQVLVRVRAAGVNGLDYKIREGWVQGAFPLPLPATLGIELAGEVAVVGEGARRLKVGDRVLGALGGLGAYADFAVVDEAKLAPIPDGLSDVQAAAMPVITLTASQVLRAGGLKAGQTVLIHGAAGGVGGIAVQLAKAAGARVIAVASGPRVERVAALGADQVIDRTTTRFEDQVSDVDLVVDLAGGDTVDRSWAVLKPGGVLISTAAPDIEGRVPAGKQGRWFRNQPDTAELAALAGAVARGELLAPVSQTVGFDGLAAAIERNWITPPSGKIVLDVDL